MIDNQFTLLNYIGKGGSSKVFLAKDLDNQKCVIKVIRKDKNYHPSVAKSMLLKEHTLLQNLQEHPNIINSYSVNVNGVACLESESENIMYSVLEYAEHGPLSNFIRLTGGIEEDISRLFMFQTCQAIEFIHSQGYAHLDIKLENILLDKFFNIKVADMGASFDFSKTEGLANKRRGTVLYMAPEVKDNSGCSFYDARKADIYSLGVTFFVMLIGEFPNPHDLHDHSSTNDSDKHSYNNCS
jgi:serine/threonine protein kinase